jgi:Rhomboid family
MTSGADLFVVCKQCGSEVSPYITECPYCGHRLRRRAPKLPPVNAPARTGLRGRARSLFGHSKPGVATTSTRTRTTARSFAAVERPYATIGLVAVSCALWVIVHAEPELYLRMAVIGPLRGDWWKIATNAFAYNDGAYAFVALLTLAIFGWLLELRHGPLVVLALFVAATAAGTLVALAFYSYPLVSGANSAALAMLAAWAAPDLQALRTRAYREGDLLGAGALAALLLVMPFAREEASWMAGVTGGLVGLLVGLGINRAAAAEA